MIILPAIDLFHGQAVRLLRGDYENMTVYDTEPVNTAMKFKLSGAEWIHIVDLEGAKSGDTPNIDTVIRIKSSCGLKCEIGGEIRNMKTIERYVESGIDRVILGTVAVTHEGFVRKAVNSFGSEHVAVGVDIKNGNAAIKGWLEDSQVNAFDFCKRIQDDGVNVIICTDISRDGAMRGTNRELYASMSDSFSVNIIASGGVSTLDDVKALAEMKLYGAIIGKAYYTGAIDLKLAIEAAKS